MSSAAPTLPCPAHNADRLYLISGPDLRAHVVVDRYDIARAATRPVAGWALGRPLGQIIRRAALWGSTVTLVPIDPADTGTHPLPAPVPAQRDAAELVPA